VIEAIMDRLVAAAPSLTSVKPVEDLESIGKGTAPRNGDTFVAPFRDVPKENTLMSGGFCQHVDFLFLVAFVVRRHDDAKGGKRAGSYDTFKGEIEDALFGWPPGEDNAPCELAGGQSSSLGNGATIYVQTWKTDRYLNR